MNANGFIGAFYIGGQVLAAMTAQTLLPDCLDSCEPSSSYAAQASAATPASSDALQTFNAIIDLMELV